MPPMTIYVLGGGWITSKGFGYLRQKNIPNLEPGIPVLPAIHDVFPTPPTRVGRFDIYTKMGCFAIAMALKNAKLDKAENKRPIGIVLSSRYESMNTDQAYYQTTLENGGIYASPNLFSYTLPNIVIGESAIYFKLTGPTFTVGESEEYGLGFNALKTAIQFIRADQTEKMVAGWLDYPYAPFAGQRGDALINGCAVVVLSKVTNNPGDSTQIIYDESNRIMMNGKSVTSIVDLFASG